MNNMDEHKLDVEKISDAEAYAKLLKETKSKADFYKFVSIAMVSYADGIKAGVMIANAPVQPVSSAQCGALT